MVRTIVFGGCFLATAPCLLFVLARPNEMNRASIPELLRNWRLVVYEEAFGIGLALSCAVLISLYFAAAASRKKWCPVSGSARWASRKEVCKAGLAGASGIILGRWGWPSRFLRIDGDTHVMLAAPTRSGKGVGFVIPNLLDWPGSVVVLDVKGENFAATSGYRAQHGQAVFLFDPGSKFTHRWNPLSHLPVDPQLIPREMQALAFSLFPAIGGRDEFWANQARELFIGAALLLLEGRHGEATIGEIYRLLTHPDFAEIIEEEATVSENLPGELSAGWKARLLSWAKCDAAATRAGVLASARERLLPWGEPILDAATAESDFDFGDLRRSRMSIYVRVAPQSLARLEHVLRLFFEQLLMVNTRAEFGLYTGHSVPVLLMLDEFPAIGRMESVEKGIAFMASYGIRFCIIAQSEAQLRSVYGHEGAQVLADNCASRIFYAPNAMEDAVRISSLLGTRTVGQRTLSGSPGLFARRRQSVSVSEVERPLLRPDEVKELGDDDSIVFTRGCRPVRARKIRWHRDRDFKNRCVQPPRQLLQTHN